MNVGSMFIIDTVNMDIEENSTPLVFNSGLSLHPGSTPRRIREFLSSEEVVSRNIWNGISLSSLNEACRFYLGEGRQFFRVQLKSDSSLSWPLVFKETSSNLRNAPRVLSLHCASKDSDNVIIALVNLLREEGFDELGDPLAPTRYAFDTARKLITSTAVLCSDILPSAHVMTDRNAGIRVEWENAGKHLRLCVAPSKDLPTYMYLQEDLKPCPKYYIRWDCSPMQLAEKLNWLLELDRADANGNGGMHSQ